MPNRFTLAKTVLIIGLTGLLVISYVVRARLLGLIWISVRAADIQSTEDVRLFREAATDRENEFQVRLAGFNAELADYKTRLDLFLSDPQAYKQLMATERGAPIQPPSVPTRPIPPYSPAFQDQLMQFNAEFRAARQEYFENAPWMNILLAVFAIGVVSSLTFLICFEPLPGRIAYLVLLVISLVFLIGPALYSVITATVYHMPAPVYAQPGPPGYGMGQPYYRY